MLGGIAGREPKRVPGARGAEYERESIALELLPDPGTACPEMLGGMAGVENRLPREV